MRNLMFLAVIGCLVSFFSFSAFRSPFAVKKGLPASTTASCPCDDGYRQIELVYLGEDDALVEVFKDDDFSDPDNLIDTYEGVLNGETLTLDAVAAATLPDNIFTNTTYIRVSVGGDVTTIEFYSTCPSVAFPEPLEEHLILGKTFGNFTVVSHTDNLGTHCSIADIESGLGWQVGGNVVDPVNNRFGTQNNEHVVIITNSETRGIITRDGRFGFGTTGPAIGFTVDVDGGITTSGNSRFSGGENNGANAALSIRSGGQVMLLDGNEIDGTTDRLYLNNNTNQDVILARGGGDVGIGISNPNARLHIDGDLRLQSPNNHTFRIGVENDGDLKLFGDGGVNVMTVTDENARVGIGTSDPQSKLAVNGKITAKEVEVTLAGWPDYVFEDQYVLMPLAEVERYIKENHHLPDVPSEQEVKDNGLNLGEMDAILLQKIEELTLHLIALEKENKALLERLEVVEKNQ